MTTNTNFPEAWQALYDKWPPEVSRKRIWLDTELVTPQTLANYDSAADKKGISGKRWAGRKVVYPKREAILWLMEYVGK